MGPLIFTAFVLSCLGVGSLGDAEGGPTPDRTTEVSASTEDEWILAMASGGDVSALTTPGSDRRMAVEICVLAFDRRYVINILYRENVLSKETEFANEGEEAKRRAEEEEDSCIGQVQYQALQIIKHLGPSARSAVSPLTTLLDDPGSPERWEVASALGAIGPKASEAVTSLRKALDDDEAKVVAASAEALGRIGAAEAVSDLRRVFRNYEEKPTDDAKGAERLIVLQSVVTALGDMLDRLVEQGGLLGYVKLARAVSDFELAIADLRNAAREEDAADLSSRLEPLVAARDSRWLARLFRNPWVWGPLAYCGGLCSVWLLLLLSRPLWLLRIHEAMKPLQVSLPQWLGGLTMPLRLLTLVSFFARRDRVLDAWIAGHVDRAYDNFCERRTVKDRAIHVQVPAELDADMVGEVTPQLVASRFPGQRHCLLIWGEGGVGKTSLACVIAKWAMTREAETRLCRHLMLPILIEEDLDCDGSPAQDPFLEAIRGRLKVLIGEVGAIGDELLDRLLRRGRLLIMVDSSSELNAETRKCIRPAAPDFVPSALIVTSRAEESLGQVPRVTIRLLRLASDRLSPFMDAYLRMRGERDRFSDEDFTELYQRLSQLAGGRDLTVMLAKFFAEQVIASFSEGSDRGMPADVPDLMLRYLNELNRKASENDPDDRTVHDDAKRIAWQCLRETFRPSSAKRSDALQALSGEGGLDPEVRIEYLENQLRLLETRSAAKDKVGFVLDPLAEYLAALYVVETYAEDSGRWKELLTTVQSKKSEGENVQGFLIALRDCCLAQDARVPDLVRMELGRLAGDVQCRIDTCLAALESNDPEMRMNASKELGEIGSDAARAIPKLAEALKDDEEDVCQAAVWALGEMGPEAVPYLVKSLTVGTAAVRASVAEVLGGMGEAARSTVPDLSSLANDGSEEDDVRRAAAHAIAKIQPESSPVDRPT